MEVFIPYRKKNLDVKLLESQMECWATIGIEPVAIEIKGKRGDFHGRLAADNLAKEEYYFLCDLGYVPHDDIAIKCVNYADKIQNFGMAGFDCGEKSFYPQRLRFIRKGIVEKWPKPTEDNYDAEHAAAVMAAGRKVEIWGDISCQHLREFSQSSPGMVKLH